MRYKIFFIIIFSILSFSAIAQNGSYSDLAIHIRPEIASDTSLENILRRKDDSLSSVSYINVHTLPAASDIFVDSTYAGKSPLDSFSISPGLHKIKIKHKGYKDLIRHFFVNPGSTDFKDIILRPIRIYRVLEYYKRMEKLLK